MKTFVLNSTKHDSRTAYCSQCSIPCQVTTDPNQGAQVRGLGLDDLTLLEPSVMLLDQPVELRLRLLTLAFKLWVV
jgi:hypothetical protein